MIGMARADPSAEEAGSLCDLSTPRGKPHRAATEAQNTFVEQKYLHTLDKFAF